jgi:hypothetical protein
MFIEQLTKVIAMSIGSRTIEQWDGADMVPP